MSLRTLLSVVAVSIFTHHQASADSAIEPLVGFEMGPGNPGGAPLYLHSDGNFYATSAFGGAFGYTTFNPIRIGYGTIYQAKPNGEVGALCFGGLPGDTPNSDLVMSADGWLWGSTTLGSLAGGNNGTIFRVRPETGTFQTIYNVPATGGNNAPTNLVRDPATGLLWGVINRTTAAATTFSMDELTGRYVAGGVAPVTSTGEVADGAGYLWGITQTGSFGTIYKKEIANGTTTTIVPLSGTTGSFRGATPKGPLVKDGGFMWGATAAGGSGTSPGLGVVFKIEIATGTYTPVIQFGSLTGANAGVRSPSNALAADGKGYLWGIASLGGANGANGWSIYKVKTSDGSFTKVSEFGPGTNNTTYTFNNSAAARGRMPFKGLTGNASSPYLWGTTSEGGTKGFGTLFRFDPGTNHFEVMVNFTGSTGSALGGRANGRLLIDSNGLVWGTTEIGGTGNFGTVFKYDPVTRVFTSLHSFNLGGNGGFPRAGLADGGDGFLYGTASSSPNGVIYRVNQSTGAFGVAYAFPSSPVTEGSTPEGELLPDGAGNLWGTTTGGGTSSNGVLFKYTPATLTYTAMVKFTGADSGSFPGRQPSGPLVMDASGAIWGTTVYTVFKYAPSTAAFTNVFNYNDNVSIMPLKGVSVGTLSRTAAGNIRFLGTEGTKELTSSGDTARLCLRAVIYEANPTTNVVTKLHSLMEGVIGPQTPADFSPAGGLYEHTDGRFYGITKSGGVSEDNSPAGGGMIYRVATGPSVITQPYNSPSLTNFFTLVSNNTATLRGFANTNGNTITGEFEWGPTSDLGNTATATFSSGTAGTGIYQASLTHLTPASTYFYRFIAKTAAGEPAYGPKLTILTGAPSSTPATPEISVESPIGQALTDNVGSVDFGSHRAGKSFRQSVVVRNLGEGVAGVSDLTGLGASISGANAGDFVITTPLGVNLLPPAGTFQMVTGLVVTFTPGGSGTRNAMLTITSNDADEASFEVPLTGEGIVEPEIEVEAPGQLALDNGNTFDFGTGSIGAGSAHTFTIHNTGNAVLDSLHVSVDGTHSSNFVVTTQPSASVTQDTSGTFVVTFTPSAGGLRTARLLIASNDSDENPFSIQLSGTGITAPEIEVLENATNLTDNNSTLDFGSVGAGSTPAKTITVHNSGNATLSNISASLVGGGAADFIAGTLASSVSAGNETTFTLTFTPQNVGTHTATLRIASNDGDENPFDITVTGTLALPQGPAFAMQPQSQLVHLGSPATFSPLVTGDPVMTFQWNKAGKAIPGAVNSSLNIPVTKAADVASYNVIADNPVGAPVPSSAAYLGLVTLSQGTLILKAGTTLTLKCTVVAPTAPGVNVKYSWRRAGDPQPLTNGPLAVNGPVVSGADKPTLSITKMRALDSGAYTCLVTLDTPGNDPQLTHGSTQVNVVDTAPVMNPIPLPASVSVSQSIDETVSATHFPTGFTLIGLPNGLKIDPKTGRITGKPIEPSKKDTLGAYIPNKITFKASNPWGTGPALDFFMIIEALDPSLVGTFNGVVARSSHSNFGLGGHVQVTTSATGVVSGFATLAGQKHSVTGVLDISLGNDPTADLVIKRTPASLGNLQMEMNIVTGEDLLQGTIIDPGFAHVLSEVGLGAALESGLVNGAAEDARFNNPRGIAVLSNGSGYIGDTGNHAIRFVDSEADTVATLAGSPVAGAANGTGAAAGFNGPEGLALDTAGNLYVADTGNSTIRKITPAGVVTTFAGSAGLVGSTNGTGSAARFSQPCALCFDPVGNLYVVDRGNHLIRKITPAGVVTTLAGKADTAGHKDGSGTGALFNAPRGIAYDPVLKALFVTDTQNHVVRKITLAGAVTTYAGSPGVEGYADGLFANARFVEPLGIVSLGNGTLVVGDFLLVQLNPSGIAATVTDRVDTVSSLDHPVALGVDPSEDTVISVHDRLHTMFSHDGDTPLQNALVEARRNPWTTTNLVASAQQGLFNAVLATTAQPGDTSFPQGDGYVQVSVSKTGAATWTGKAGDGSTLTFGTFIAGDHSIPLHVPLYKNTGSLQGETFITSPDLDLIGDITPALDWYKIPQPLASTDRSYKSGFMLHALQLYGGKYVPNNVHSYLGQTNSPATLGLDFTQSLINSFTQSFTLTAPNAVTVPANAKSLGLKIDPKTGIFTGSFKEGSPAITVPFAGILFHYVNGGNAREGRGHYLPPTTPASTAPIRSARVRLGEGT